MALEKQRGSPRFGEATPKAGEAGQILLISILIIIVASTVGLSLASRSITSLRTSTEEADYQKANAAAEAGIERTIQGSSPVIVEGSLPNGASYATNFNQISGGKFLISGGNAISKDEGADVWFVGHDSSGIPIYSEARSVAFFNLYWGSTAEICGTATAPAALEAIVVSRNNSTGLIRSYRYVYDSCPNRRQVNNFTLANNSGPFTIDGIAVNFGNRTPPSDLANGIDDIIFIRVIPIYKDAVIGVSTCNLGGQNCADLPTQGYIANSTGISGQANQKLTVFKGYPQTYLPYLSYGLFVASN